MPNTLTDRNILIFVCDAGARPLVGARVAFSLDGVPAGEVPVSAGRASISVPNREAKVEVTASYGEKEKKALLAADADSYTFRFDVAAERSTQQLRRWVYVAIALVGLGASVPAFVLLFGKPGSYSGVASQQAYFLVLLWAGVGVAAFTFGAMNSVASVSGTPLGFTVQAGGPAAMLLIVVGAGFALPKPQQFELLVRVTDVTSGSFLKTGSVKLAFDTGIRTASISPEGEAHFGGVSEGVIGTTLTVELESSEYDLAPESRQAKVSSPTLALSAKHKPVQPPPSKRICAVDAHDSGRWANRCPKPKELPCSPAEEQRLKGLQAFQDCDTFTLYECP